MIYIHRKIKNPLKDGIEIGEEIKRKVGRASLIIFITTIFDKEKLKQVFEGMKQQIPLDNLIGCTSGGTFVGNNYIKKDGVLILAFDEHYKSAVSCEIISNNPEEVGTYIANEIKTSIRERYQKLDIDENFLGFIFFDWDKDSEQEILDVLGKELGIPIVGGTAGEDGTFDKYFLIYKGEIVRDCCVFGVVGGKLKFDLIYGHGYKPTNIYARVTKAEGRVVYELDGKPAYQRYEEMISEYTKLPKDVVEKYLRANTTERLKYITLYHFHPLGFVDVNGNVITAFLEKIDGDTLVFRRKIAEGSFLILMKTDFVSQIRAIYDKVKNVEKDYKNPLIFINGCYSIEVLKNPMYRRYEGEVLQYFLEFFYKDMEVVDKYILGNNCIGWLSYGEAVSKDLIRVYNNLSFTGVIFELSQDNYINWKEELKNFDFDEDEIEVIVNLLNKSLTAKELLQLTNISQTKLYQMLNNLEHEGIIKSVGGKPKLYYIDNIKEILQRRHEIIERENMIKRVRRERLLRML